MYIVSLVSIAETKGHSSECANPSETASEESVVTPKSKEYTWMLLLVLLEQARAVLGIFY